MSSIINASIDLAKIDKSKIVATDKNGQPFANGAKYLNITIFVNDQPDQFGNNASIAVNQSQQERESGAKRVYLGNGKTVGAAPATQQAAPQQAQPTLTEQLQENDLPF